MNTNLAKKEEEENSSKLDKRDQKNTHIHTQTHTNREILMCKD